MEKSQLLPAVSLYLHFAQKIIQYIDPSDPLVIGNRIHIQRQDTFWVFSWIFCKGLSSLSSVFSYRTVAATCTYFSPISSLATKSI